MRLHLEPAAHALTKQGPTARTHALVSSFWAQVQPIHEEPGPSGGPEITHRIWLPGESGHAASQGRADFFHPDHP